MVILILIVLACGLRYQRDYRYAFQSMFKQKVFKAHYRASRVWLGALLLLVSTGSIGVLFQLNATMITMLIISTLFGGLLQLHIMCSYQNHREAFQSLYLFLSYNASLFRTWEKALPCLEGIVAIEPFYKNWVDEILNELEKGGTLIEAYRRRSSHYLVVTLAVIMEMAETYGNAGLDLALLSYEEDLDQWKIYTEKLHQDLLGMRLKVLILIFMSIGIAYLSIGMLNQTIAIVHNKFYQYSVTGFLVLIQIVLIETTKGLQHTWISKEECID